MLKGQNFHIYKGLSSFCFLITPLFKNEKNLVRVRLPQHEVSEPKTSKLSKFCIFHIWNIDIVKYKIGQS